MRGRSGLGAGTPLTSSLCHRWSGENWGMPPAPSPPSGSTCLGTSSRGLCRPFLHGHGLSLPGVPRGSSRPSGRATVFFSCDELYIGRCLPWPGPRLSPLTPAKGGTRSCRLFPAAQQPGQRRSPPGAWRQLRAAPRRRAQRPCQASPGLGGGAPHPAHHPPAAPCASQRPLAAGSGAGSKRHSSPTCCDLNAGSLSPGSRESQTREPLPVAGWRLLRFFLWPLCPASLLSAGACF